MTEILLVDDHAVMRAGLVRLLSEHDRFHVCREVGTGKEAITYVRESPPDVVVLDLSMPDMHGLEVLKQLRTIAPDLPVIILSMHAEHQYAVHAIKSGASAYLTKESAPETLVEALDTAARGGRYITPSVGAELANTISVPENASGQIALSERQQQVLAYLGDGLSQSEIAQRLKISVKTVATYRRQLLDRLGLRTTADLVRYSLEAGYAEKPLVTSDQSNHP